MTIFTYYVRELHAHGVEDLREVGLVERSASRLSAGRIGRIGDAVQHQGP